jgi:GDPmannose 4,6-dehydratase
VAVSFEEPEYTPTPTPSAPLPSRRPSGSCREKDPFYQASTSELFQGPEDPPAETTPYLPPEPLRLRQDLRLLITVNYREPTHHACNGILFNHESPVRAKPYVHPQDHPPCPGSSSASRTPSIWAISISSRDWGHARTTWNAVGSSQQKSPNDFVTGHGRPYSVRAFVDPPPRRSHASPGPRGVERTAPGQTPRAPRHRRVDPPISAPRRWKPSWAIPPSPEKARLDPPAPPSELVAEMSGRPQDRRADELVKKHGYTVYCHNE